MKRIRFLTLIVGLIATFGAAQASAEDRFFMVNVQLIAGGQSPLFAAPNRPGPNCYSFSGDGTWIDPLWPGGAGTWESDPNGAITRYTAMADFAVAGLSIVQEGQITPTTGNGTVRLQAFSTVFVTGTPIVLAEFMSTGYEVDACP